MSSLFNLGVRKFINSIVIIVTAFCIDPLKQ